MNRRLIQLIVFWVIAVSLFAANGNHAMAGYRQQAQAENVSSLPAAAQASISAVLGRDDPSYHAVAQGKGFSAKNTKHDLSADFTAKGVQVQTGNSRWGLSLSSYGYGERLRAVKSAAPDAMDNRVEYRRGAVTEWYVNGPMGLEQGFTLSRPPCKSGKGPLTLGLRLSGDMAASVDAKADGLTLTRDGQAALTYSGLTAFDAGGRQLQAWLEAKDGRLLLRVDDANALYPIIVDPYIRTTRLTASDGATYDHLGSSVAISGDTVVAGAFNNREQGAVYVFVKTVDGWPRTETAKLTASDGAAYDSFGISLAISGDTVVVGADYATVGSNVHQGAAYVFVKPAGGWRSMTETAKLTASGGAADSAFGNSASVSGDTVLIGAYYTGGSYRYGAAYVFVKPAGGWTSMTETAKLTPSDVMDHDHFGSDVAVSGSVAVVGSTKSDGAAYLFVKPGSGWKSMTETAKLTASDGPQFYLGFSVAINGDTVVAGAPYIAVGSNEHQGAAYLFVKPASGWTSMTETAKLTASDGARDDYFGRSMAITGDTVVVGRPGSNTTGQPTFL